MSDEHLDISPVVPADRQTVDEAGRRLDVTIDGVVHHRLGPIHADLRGSLLEIVDSGTSRTDAGRAKPHLKLRLRVRPCCPCGSCEPPRRSLMLAA